MDDDFFFGVGITFAFYAVILLIAVVFTLVVDWKWQRDCEAYDAFRRAQREADVRRYVDDGALR